MILFFLIMRLESRFLVWKNFVSAAPLNISIWSMGLRMKDTASAIPSYVVTGGKCMCLWCMCICVCVYVCLYVCINVYMCVYVCMFLLVVRTITISTSE